MKFYELKKLGWSLESDRLSSIPNFTDACVHTHTHLHPHPHPHPHTPTPIYTHTHTHPHPHTQHMTDKEGEEARDIKELAQVIVGLAAKRL
jgi:hypothetical protein